MHLISRKQRVTYCINSAWYHLQQCKQWTWIATQAKVTHKLDLFVSLHKANNTYFVLMLGSQCNGKHCLHCLAKKHQVHNAKYTVCMENWKRVVIKSFRFKFLYVKCARNVNKIVINIYNKIPVTFFYNNTKINFLIQTWVMRLLKKKFYKRSTVWKTFGSVLDSNGTELEHVVGCKKCFNVYKHNQNALPIKLG